MRYESVTTQFFGERYKFFWRLIGSQADLRPVLLHPLVDAGTVAARKILGAERQMAGVGTQYRQLALALDLVAIGDQLETLIERHGERDDPVVLGVPVSPAYGTDPGTRLGSAVGPIFEQRRSFGVESYAVSVGQFA